MVSVVQRRRGISGDDLEDGRGLAKPLGYGAAGDFGRRRRSKHVLLQLFANASLAIVFLVVGAALHAFLGASDGRASLASFRSSHLGLRGADFPDPAWTLADESDDYYERLYMPKSQLWAVRDIERKFYFTGRCGHYRFDLSAMPDVSVIITTQNEQDGMLSVSVHSILARTPPSLLKEIIIVDDNGVGGERGKLNETEFEELRHLHPKVSIIKNKERDGCARSRMAGARAATGEVLMFVDSHIEMESSTWLQHLLVPIMENPHTMALQTLDIISDLDHSYGNAGGDLLYGIVTDQFFFGYQRARFDGADEEKPGRRLPYETPFGPGSLFAIRRDEFWRLGGYDKGLYVWGGENTELALKMWTCGGRMVMVPCSRVGHMYRIHISKTGRWPPYLPKELTDRLGCAKSGQFLVQGNPADNFTKIISRNNIRIMETWVGDHPAKAGYYQKHFGSSVLPPEWQQYVDEMQTDAAAIEQIQIRKRNKCRDFEWFDKHVYMKIVGVHHPWHPSIKNKTWV